MHEASGDVDEGGRVVRWDELLGQRAFAGRCRRRFGHRRLLSRAGRVRIINCRRLPVFGGFVLMVRGLE